MSLWPKRVQEAWETREGPAILTTADATGKPNSVYVGEIRHEEEGFVVADNYFCKTRANLQVNKAGAILFITKERKSFQVKGTLFYHTEGPIFEGMKKWHDPKHPGVAAVLLRVEEVYSGSEKLV